MLDKESGARAVELNRGRAITVTGRVNGLLGNALLRDCDF